MTEEDLYALTGCALPCVYRSYEIKRFTSVSSKVFGFRLLLTSNVEEVETEVWTYGIASFIAEFGGALGLFTGFSFYCLWDIFLSIAMFLHTLVK